MLFRGGSVVLDCGVEFWYYGLVEQVAGGRGGWTKGRGGEKDSRLGCPLCCY